MYRGREGRHSRKYTGAWQWLGLARTWAVSEELVGGEEERKGGQILVFEWSVPDSCCTASMCCKPPQVPYWNLSLG